VTKTPPAAYPPDHVHESKKLIAKRLGKCVKYLNKLMDQVENPLPVTWCRRRHAWIIVEAELVAWDAGQRVTADKAEEMGLVPKRRKAA
jgi:hypothetical protein